MGHEQAPQPALDAAAPPWDALIEQHPSAAVVHNAAGELVGFNDRATRLFRGQLTVGNPISSLGLFAQQGAYSAAAIDGAIVGGLVEVELADALIEARFLSTCFVAHDDVELRLVLFFDIERSAPTQASLETSDEMSIERAAVFASEVAFYDLRAVFDDDGECVDFVFADLNLAAERQLGSGRATLLHKHINDLYPINEEGGFFSQYKAVFAQRRGYAQVYEVPAGEPAAGWYKQEVVPTPLGVAIFNRGLDDLRRAEAQRDTAVGAIGGVAIVVDNDGHVVATSSDTATWAGHANATTAGTPLASLINDDDLVAMLREGRAPRSYPSPFANGPRLLTWTSRPQTQATGWQLLLATPA